MSKTSPSPEGNLPVASSAVAGSLPSGDNLLEDTLTVSEAAVTLSTFYDGADRAIRSVLVAHSVDVPDTARHTLASFELDFLPGKPDPDQAREIHLRNANLVARLLAGQPDASIEHGDLIRAVLDAATFYVSGLSFNDAVSAAHLALPAAD